VVTAALLLGSAPPPAAGDPAALAVALVEAMETAYAPITSFTARFVRQERIGGDLRPPEEVALKWQRPGRIHMRWIAGPPTGRQIIFVPGRDDDNVLIREPGILTRLVTVVTAPGSPDVMKQSRHPITDVGFGHLIELIGATVRRAAGRGELTLIEHERPSGGRTLEVRLPRDPRQGYYCYRAVVTIDDETRLPVAIAVYDWDDRLVERYEYRDLAIDPPLTAADFDPGNPAYGFPTWRVKR
jgi:outer membrane lipoprotein-sorting protein